MAVVGLAFTTQQGDSIQVHSQVAGTIIATAVFFHVCNFAYSWGPTTWVYCAEIYPMRVRGRCVGITTMAEWTGVFLVNQFTPMLLDALGFGAFFVFGAFSVAAVVLAWWLPETRGVPLECMDDVFNSRLGASCGDASQPKTAGHLEC